MGSGVERPPAHRLYSDYLENPDAGSVALDLWGTIPVTMGDAYRQLVRTRKTYGEAQDAVEELKRAIKKNLRRLGVLTSKAMEAIDRIDRGVAEVGQQPYCLGGSSLTLNKIAYVTAMSCMGEDGFAPLFYVADYDGVQPELLNTWVPSPSPRGLLLTYPSEPEFEGSPIYELPNPPESWLKKTLERIEGNYRGLLRGEGSEVRDRVLWNLSHAFTILRGAYHSTENVSDWATKTVGSIVNLEADLGVPILPFSATEARPLFQPGYELLLSEPNRSRFIEAANMASEIIEGAGYRSPMGRRTGGYVPFFIECQSKGCHRTRIEPKYMEEHDSSTASVVGRCPKCGEAYEYSFSTSRPDLSELICWISPRVDSRQVVVDTVYPALTHVGGPGETNYYAEVIPAAKALDLPFPVFLRYTRTFYNTPWNDRYSGRLSEKGYPTLTDGGLFSSLGRWVEARNAGNGVGLLKAHRDLRDSIEGTYERLLDILSGLQFEVEEIKARLREPDKREALIGKMREKQSATHEIELYLSSAFGRFSPERFGQEVSWAWLDLAAASGVGDLMGAYMRIYNEDTPNSSMFYVNL